MKEAANFGVNGLSMANTLNESVCEFDRARYRFVLASAKGAPSSHFVVRVITEISGRVQMSTCIGLVVMGLLAAGVASWLNSSLLISGLVSVRINGLSMANTLNESVGKQS